MTDVTDFLAALAPLTRRAYVPEVSSSPASDTASRYFGCPWGQPGAFWPEFEGQPLQFVLQLNTSELPAPWGVSDPAEAELIQFFYDVGSDTSEIRRVKLNQAGGLLAAPDNIHVQPALAIAVWHPVLDHPWVEDFDEVFGDDRFEGADEGVGSSTSGQFLGQDGREYPEATAAKEGIPANYHCFECDKLGGWPRWEQGSETPEDSQGSPMVFLMQVGFEGLLLGDVPDDLEWPTWGRGQIFFSEPTGEFEYVWACD